MDFVDEMLRLMAALNARRVEYVLVGGGALNVLGLVRATEDLDLFVRPTVENIERLKQALGDVWHDAEIAQILPSDLMGEYPAVRYGPPSGSLYLDILTRLGEFAAYEDLEAQTIEVRGVPVRVATPRTLHWMKRGTVRPLDHADAQALRDNFEFEPRED
jgi:hypothetical protein